MKIKVLVELESLPMKYAIVTNEGLVSALFYEERHARSFFQSSHGLGLREIAMIGDEE